MAKKLLILVLVLVVAAAAYFGIVSYQNSHLTADQSMDRFLARLTEGDADKTYASFTPNLKKTISADEWSQYIVFYKDYNGEPKLQKHEPIKDSFNVYPKGSEAQRYVYLFTFKGQEYQMLLVTYKQGSSWVIDELQGTNQ